MKRIIGFTDSVTECECCGKTDLKGTYCLEIDGVELYYGSVCAFKSHGLTEPEQKQLVARFKGEKKRTAKFEKLEEDYRNSCASVRNHYLRKMFNFVKEHKMDLRAFCEKYADATDETRWEKIYFILGNGIGFEK